MLARLGLAVGGVLFLVQVAIGLLGLPRPLVRWLAAEDLKLKERPDYVVVLGGAGMPSSSGLIRTYYGAVYSGGHSGTIYVVCLPTDGPIEQSGVARMRDEMVLRGIPRERVLLEAEGRDTRAEAVNVQRLLGRDALSRPLLIVSQPSHLRRAYLCFREVGFTQIGCLAATSVDVDADMGRGLWWRYGFWDNMAGEVETARELLALVYYRLKGWL